MVVGILISTVVTVTVIYSSFGFIIFLKRTYHSTKALRQFPSEKAHWFWGHLGVHPGPNHEGLLTNIEWTRLNPRYYTVYIGPLRPILVLNHPETVKQMLRTTEPKAVMGGSGYSLLEPWLGDGLLLSCGNKWFRNRRLLTPGFHFDVLKPYIDVYNNCAETLMDKFEKMSHNTKQSMEIFKPVSLCTLDIILRCAFSTQRDVQEQGDKEPYVNTVTSLSQLIIKRSQKPYLFINSVYNRTQNGKRFKYLCDYSHSVATDVINRRRQELANSSITNSTEDSEQRKYVDFLDILLLARDELGNGLTEVEIRDEVETFMFEGHDTTSSAISWILYNLARHPEIQSKAREEVDSVLHGRKSNALQWNDLSRLPYLTLCIKESLRLHPPVHFVSRQASKPFAIDGKLLPIYTLINVSIWNVHHNPDVWPDPMMYDPERFRPEKMSEMDSHAFIPFSAGPRNCIGQNFAMHELKTVIARILRRFQFNLDLTVETRMLPSIVLRAESGIYLFFKKRDNI